MRPKLRPYQIDLIDRVRASMNAGNRRVLLQLPTGGGKTLVASEILKQTSENGYHSIFLADRRKLIDQTGEKLASYGVDHGIIMAGRKPDFDAPVQVASIQTLYSRAIKRDVMEMPDVQLVIVDEAHKSLGNQYKELIEDWYPHAHLIGLTATPYRADGRGLNELYSDIVLGPSVDDLVDEGFLVPMRYYAPSAPDMAYLETIVDKQRGDYNEVQLGKYMENDKPLIGDIVKHYERIGEGKQAVIFASSVRHSMYLAEAFNRAGIAAEHIDGTTYHIDRQRIYEDVHSGRTRVLTNYGVLTEGWDEPQIAVCILARPTKSVATYLQMAGRVLRPYPGKGHAILIDHSGSVRELGFVHEARDWTLLPTKATADPNDPMAKIDEGNEIEERDENIVCENCYTVYKGRRTCPNCGWEPPKRKPKQVKILEAELEELIAKRAHDDYRLDFYERCLGYERTGKAPKGWAKEAWTLKFKEGVPPKPTKLGLPDDEIKNWHTHMRIRAKYSKYPKRKVVNL